MKAIKRVALKEATQLSQEEMKLIFGGSGTEDECAGKPSAIACKDSEHNVIHSGSSTGCTTDTIRSVCGNRNWRYAICSCIGGSGTEITY